MAETTDIVKVDARQIITGKDVQLDTYDGRQILVNLQMIRSLIPGAAKANDFELAGFVAFCQANKLDPLRRQVHFIKYSDHEPAAWPVSYMVYHDRAQRHPGYDGYESGIVWEFDGAISRGGVCDYAPADDSAKIVGGWCRVYRKDRAQPVYVEVPFEEAVQTKRDKQSGERVPNTNWQNKPTTMMTKVAESRALRKAFPEELGNTFSDAEPYMASPDMATAAAELPKRGEEPIDVEPEELPPLHRVAAKVKELAPDVDEDTMNRVMQKTAQRATERPAEEFEDADAWTDEVADKAIEMLDAFGIDPQWIGEPDNGEAT